MCTTTYTILINVVEPIIHIFACSIAFIASKSRPVVFGSRPRHVYLTQVRRGEELFLQGKEGTAYEHTSTNYSQLSDGEVWASILISCLNVTVKKATLD